MLAVLPCNVRSERISHWSRQAIRVWKMGSGSASHHGAVPLGQQGTTISPQLPWHCLHHKISLQNNYRNRQINRQINKLNNVHPSLLYSAGTSTDLGSCW